MKLTESMNICCVSDRVGCTNKTDVKETPMGNYSVLNVFVVNGLQSENKNLLIDKFSV